jgi:hypothetical protein
MRRMIMTMAHEPRTANREPGILINWFVVAARGSRLRSRLSFCRDETHSSQLYDSPYDLTRPPTHCRPAADPGPPARATHCASLSPAPHTARRSLPRARALAVPAFPVRSADPTHRPSLASLAHTHTPNATYPRSRTASASAPPWYCANSHTRTPHTRTRPCLFSAARQIDRHGDVIPGCTPRAPTRRAGCDRPAKRSECVWHCWRWQDLGAGPAGSVCDLLVRARSPICL